MSLLGASPLRDSSLSKFESRSRNSSTGGLNHESYIQIELLSQSNFERKKMFDLPDLIALANRGMMSNVKPILADDGLGGTYFFRDDKLNMVIVCKPGDEERNSPFNPHQNASKDSSWGGWYKGHIVPGFGMYREIAAFTLDQGFAGVPATQLARLKDFACKEDGTAEMQSSHGFKACSVQSYVRHECTAEDMGPAKFSLEDVQRIAAFDIRLCNLDRHEGNMLVCATNPFRVADDHATFELTNDSDPMFDFDNDSPRSHDSHAQDQFHLVPIDHGYVLPHALYMTEPSLSWMQWPQSAEPITEPVLTHIKSLDYARDAEALRRVVGAALPETSLLTLQVCTSFLKKGAAAGLTLREMASAMCYGNGHDSVSSGLATVSLLQRYVYKAIRRTDSKKPRNSLPFNPEPYLSIDDSMLSKRSSPGVSLDASPSTEKLFSTLSSQSVDPDKLPLQSPVSVTHFFDPTRPPRARESLLPVALRETVSLRGISEFRDIYEAPVTSSRVDEDMLRRAMAIDDGAALASALDITLDELISQLTLAN